MAQEPKTPEEITEAALAADPAVTQPVVEPVINRRELPDIDADVVKTNLPPVRRRATRAALPPDASAAQIAQQEADLALAANDTTHLTETERHSLETQAGADRRIAVEAEAEENTRLAMEAGQQQAKTQAEYEQQLADYHTKEAKRLAAHADDPMPLAKGMVRVVIMRNVTLVRQDGTSSTFTTDGSNTGIPGTWDMTQDDADHWYIQAHSDDPPPPLPPMPGTAAAIAIANQTAQRRLLVEAALDQEENAALDKLRAERRDRLKAALGDAYEPAPV